jgi:hypothetical protein
MDDARTTLVALFLSVVLTLAVLPAGVAGTQTGQETLTVDKDGSADYRSIQAAVEAADSGDTVEVRPGTYYEEVTVNESITLVAPDRAILDGSRFVNGTGVTVAGAAEPNVRRIHAPDGGGCMSLDDLTDDVRDNYSDLDEELSMATDRETRNELAMLQAALDPEETDELLRRAVHLLFQTTVETGTLDFHLRSEYDVTYDEYLSGMTFEEMTGGQFPQAQQNDDRRYQF